MKKQVAQLPSLWSSESLLLSSRPASSPRLPHADTHSRIEHFASRYHQVWGIGIIRNLMGKGFSLGAKRKESVLGRVCTVGYVAASEAQHLDVVGTAPKTNILLWD